MTLSRLEYYLFCENQSDSGLNLLGVGSDSLVVKVDRLSNNYEHLKKINSDNNQFLQGCYSNDHFLKIYCDPVSNILNKFDINKTVRVAIGDNRLSFDTPTLVKSRVRGASNCILFKLNAWRHWTPCSFVKENDIRFRDKLPAVCWRGATTGLWRDDIDDEMNSSRFNLMRLWSKYSEPILNIGLSKFAPSTNHKLGASTRGMIQSFIRNELTLSEQLKYRYILSLEGNDVATNLKWIMCSNSIPVMPAPSVESWAMELTLEPWINYVPIKHDTSDLLDSIAIAEKDIRLTRRIRKHNKLMMKKYFKESSEDALMADILLRMN